MNNIRRTVREAIKDVTRRLPANVVELADEAWLHMSEFEHYFDPDFVADHYPLDSWLTRDAIDVVQEFADANARWRRSHGLADALRMLRAIDEADDLPVHIRIRSVSREAQAELDAARDIVVNLVNASRHAIRK